MVGLFEWLVGDRMNPSSPIMSSTGTINMGTSLNNKASQKFYVGLGDTDFQQVAETRRGYGAPPIERQCTKAEPVAPIEAFCKFLHLWYC